MYNIIKNKNHIDAFKADEIFTIFESNKQQQSNLTCDIYNLHKYIAQDNEMVRINKSSRNFIIFNQTKDGLKTKDSFYLPKLIMLDIDFKNSEERQKNLMKDMGCGDFETALDELYTRLRNDSSTLYLDRSKSNMGVKAFFRIISNYYVKNYANFEPKENSPEPSVLMEQNFKILKEYLKDNIGINEHSNSYIDEVGGRIQQGCYSSWGHYYYANPNASIIQYNFVNEIIEKKIISKYNFLKKGNTDFIEVREQNDTWVEQFQKEYKLAYNNVIEGDKSLKSKLDTYNNILSPKLKHYDSSLIVFFSLKVSSEQTRYFFYSLFKLLYKGGSIDLKSFQSFNYFIDNTFRKVKDAKPLSDIFPEIQFNTPIVDSDDITDFFGNKYNQVIKFGLKSNYISEVANQIIDIYDKNNFIVITADAGTGKTTFNIDYITDKLIKKEINRAVMVIPKNSLLEQQNYILEHIESKVSKFGIKVFKNYGKDNYKDEMGDGIILSSTPKLNRIKSADILFIDEIQNLVNYSSEIYSKYDKSKFGKIILFSATPEKYLIFEKDYYYVKLLNVNSKKPILNKIISNQHNRVIKDLINKDRKQYIFFNNIEESKIKFNKKNFDIDFQFINSFDKDTIENVNVIKNQELLNNHVVCTSFMTDGINFNNEEWDDIIIVENGTLSPDEIYQISKRFRKIDNINVYLISKPRKFKITDTEELYKYFCKFNNYDWYHSKLKLGYEQEKQMIQGYEITFDDNWFVNYNKGGKVYKRFNPDSLKKWIFDKRFLNFYNNVQEIQSMSLKYYFSLTTEFKLSDSEDIKFNRNTELNDLFIKHKLNLIEELKFNNMSFDKINLNNGQDEHIIKNNPSYFIKLFERYEEIIKYNGDTDKAILQSNHYTRYIKNIKYKYIGGFKDKIGLDDEGKYIWDKQELFYNISLSVKQSHKNYNFVTIEDVFNLFNNDKKLLNKFLDRLDIKSLIVKQPKFGQDVILTERAIVDFMSNIIRHFEQKRIIRNKTKYTIYLLN